VWVKRQIDGELDDSRLTEGLTGESTVYKRRGMEKPELGRPQIKPKRIKFIFDLSASMYCVLMIKRPPLLTNPLGTVSSTMVASRGAWKQVTMFLQGVVLLLTHFGSCYAYGNVPQPFSQGEVCMGCMLSYSSLSESVEADTGTSCR
jgi:hypothetical protein